MAPHRIGSQDASQARIKEAAIPRFASFDGTMIHYEQSGRGEPVLLLHSFPFDSRIWASTGVADAIIAAGRSVIAADRRGSGRSARPHDPRAYAGNACARDVTALSIISGLIRRTWPGIRSGP
jgi:pimeloyl-ACP methyl ester carboxylesterase